MKIATLRPTVPSKAQVQHFVDRLLWITLPETSFSLEWPSYVVLHTHDMTNLQDIHKHDEAEPDTSTAVAEHSSPLQSQTLLPSPIANAVSLVTRTSSLYLQLGSFIGGLALDGARVTTLTGLEVSRAVIESILHRAGQDVALRSTGDLGRAEAESLLERSIGTLHSTITAMSFAASTGFYISATALGSATDLSQQLLASLDSVLGSTDSSRAISSIVTLIRREFQNPATGQEGEKVGVADLLIGICGLALLQRWCEKIVALETQEKRWEEVVWDVVVLNDGRRADYEKALIPANTTGEVVSTRNFAVPGIMSDVQTNEDSDDDMAEIQLKQKIMQSLPEHASVSITTETTTTRTVTVEVTGGPDNYSVDLKLPSGVQVVEQNVHFPSTITQPEEGYDAAAPQYRTVYTITKRKLLGTSILSEGAADQFAPEAGYDTISPQDDDETIRCLPEPSEVTPEADTLCVTATPISSPKPAVRENTANQKRIRQPTTSSSSTTDLAKPPAKRSTGAHLPNLTKKNQIKPVDVKGTFRNALRKGSSTTISNLWSDRSNSKSPSNSPSWSAPTTSSTFRVQNAPQRHTPAISSTRITPVSRRGSVSHDRPQRDKTPPSPTAARPSSRTSFYSVHEHRSDSLVSQTDSHSIHSAESRPGSPTTFRTHLRAHSQLMRARSEKNIASSIVSPTLNHHRSKSHVPSIYTINTNPSSSSLVLAPSRRIGAFDDQEALSTLARTGFIGGLFPQHHLVRNITRFIRFASASYGSSFLRVMGIVASTTASKKEIDTKHHHEHHSFSNHTQLPPDTILLSSFVDPAGGTDSSGHTGTGVPMVHFVSLDHDSKAVVLTCRGTLGFEDVLTDMTCDYDTLNYQGKPYSVHEGIHASAQRLVDGAGGRVMATIKAALEEFLDYGLVMCGHSLGGAVVALLAIMVSEPSPDPTSTAFVTAVTAESPRLLHASSTATFDTMPPRVHHLPAGRPIHVYAYGPPATLSPSLRQATRGLITTIINGQDLVPYLSLGVLHDLQAVALAFKNDDSGAKGEVRARVWEGLKGNFSDRWYNRSGANKTSTTEDDQWAYSALKALRASMLSAKLVPPGEVFRIENTPVLQRDVGAGVGDAGLGRSATRSVLRYVRDVEKKFGEVRFGGSMLLDHSPGRYEASLGSLGKGVLV